MSEDPEGGEGCSEAAPSLSSNQLERIKRNREKAKSIRQARLQSAKPYDTTTRRPHHVSPESRSEEKERRRLESWASSGVCSKSSAGRDTGGGFLLDEEEEEMGARGGRGYKSVEDDAPALPDERMVCVECRKTFAESFLFSKFSFSVCDQCRDPKEKHALITKTEAKQKYLLKDCDFGERGGEPLPFILKRNPHSSYRNDMHLFLAIQVETRAHEVWGGKEGLEGERERKREAREKKREKKYVKEIQKLRKAVRSSTVTTTPRGHEHVFSSETYCSDTDSWTKTCEDCGHKITYEKM